MGRLSKRNIVLILFALLLMTIGTSAISPLPLPPLALPPPLLTSSSSTDVLTFCESGNTTVTAGPDGTILSPQVGESEPVDCTLELIGIPENSWFRLAVGSFNFPCYLRGADGKFSRSSITADGYRSKAMCRQYLHPYRVDDMYLFKTTAGPLVLRLNSQNFTSGFYFNLTYTVASVVDASYHISHNEVDAKGQSSGNVVSHSSYDGSNSKYRRDVSSQLTLFNLALNHIEISFKSLSLYHYYDYCPDYLLVVYNETFQTKICGGQKSEYINTWKKFDISHNAVTFHLITTSIYTRSGFEFRYRVIDGIINSTPSTTSLVEVMTAAERLTSQSSGIFKEDGITKTAESHISVEASDLESSEESEEESSEVNAGNQDQSNSSPGGSNWRAGVGVGAGVVLIIIVITLLILLIRRRSRTQRREPRIETDFVQDVSSINVAASNPSYDVPTIYSAPDSCSKPGEGREPATEQLSHYYLADDRIAFGQSYNQPSRPVPASRKSIEMIQNSLYGT